MRVTDTKLENLTKIIRQQGRVHIFFAEDFLRVSDKYFRYNILPRFLYKYEFEMQGPFIVVPAQSQTQSQQAPTMEAPA